ncbi:MAG: DUF4157 domain-containing protein [Chloroflexi bacterium]|nr:DUF4157 domain-containing protein [Chloroflexota bacterium]
MSEHVAAAQQQNTSRSQQSALSVENFQRQAVVNHDEPTALPELKLDTLSGDSAEPRLGFDFSGVPAFTGMARQARPFLQTKPMTQRSPKDENSGSVPCLSCSDAESTQTFESDESTVETGLPAHEAAPTAAPTEPTTEEQAETAETPASGLIVEDSATELGPGQMPRSEFLSQLRTEVCRTVETAIAGTGRSTEDCPYLDHWFGYYDRQDSAHIERAIRRYAPESSNATTARGYISAVTQRSRQSAETWARTGEITGVPQGIPTELPGPGLLGGLISGIGSIFFKARKGGAKAADNPQAIQAKLGKGQPLDSSVRSRMESAFGMDFSYVRTHTDSTATELSNRFNARAFTVGEHVAFGSGEYKPGSLLGDALIAHELAHVVQQGSASASVAPMEIKDAGNNALEKDADKSAVGAMASLWCGAKGGFANLFKNAIPKLKSGLRLQQCTAQRPRGRTTPTPQPQQQVPTAPPRCPPALNDPKWDVARTPVLVRVPGCRLQLGKSFAPSGSRFGLDGMEFNDYISIAPNCNGQVYFVQYVNVNRVHINCMGNRPLGLCPSHSWGIDTAWPYPSGSVVNTQSNSPNRKPIKTVDSPGVRRLSIQGLFQVRVCINDEFVTYIVYEDDSARVTPLGWMHWRFNAQAWRDSGNCPPSSTSLDCSGWHLTGAGTKMGESFRPGIMNGSAALNSSDRSATPIDSISLMVNAPSCPATRCTVPSSPPSSP